MRRLRTFIGHDAREPRSFAVACASALAHDFEPLPLCADILRASGLMTRPVDERGQMWDLNSSAPQSTTFATARFWVPLLAHRGWVLFVDGDVLFLRSAEELLALADPRYAVMVVKHEVGAVSGSKMDGQAQTAYPRKLWSSVMLWNCDHKANRRLNLLALNQLPGRDLHAFCWLHDDEVGALPTEWNWLVGMQEKPARPAIAHFTLGTPELVDEFKCEHADLWLRATEEYGV